MRSVSMMRIRFNDDSAGAAGRRQYGSSGRRAPSDSQLVVPDFPVGGSIGKRHDLLRQRPSPSGRRQDRGRNEPAGLWRHQDPDRRCAQQDQRHS